MITVRREGVLLETTGLKFENESVMNPAVIAEGNTVHLFYRATSEGNLSSIGYCKLEGPLTVVERRDKPLLFPEFDYESQGVEDPRIVKIENTYYLTYTAYDGYSAMGALATSDTVEHFTKRGVITSQFTYQQFKKRVTPERKKASKYFRTNNRRESVSPTGKKIYLTDKNLVFFPRKINGKFFFLHRIKPDIQWVAVDNLEDLTESFWDNYFLNFTNHIFFESRYPHESSYLGAGCPPIELPEGWLVIYHSVCDTPSGYVYSASAALFDLDNPTIEIARLPYPLFSPETRYEMEGVVNKVCFPTGAALFDGRLYIYYGAADKCIACASVRMSELINELMRYKNE